MPCEHALTRRWRQALGLLSKMNERGLTPDVCTYTSAMCACDRAGEWQASRQLFQHFTARLSVQDMAGKHSNRFLVAAENSDGYRSVVDEILDTMRGTLTRQTSSLRAIIFRSYCVRGYMANDYEQNCVDPPSVSNHMSVCLVVRCNRPFFCLRLSVVSANSAP